jgi:hypothetical protein
MAGANANEPTALGGLLFHDFRGAPPPDPRPCTHGPESPARVSVFRGRVERGYAVFNPDDAAADAELTNEDCMCLREVAYFRQHFRVVRWKCQGNSKGCVVEEVHGALALERAGEPAAWETLERGWLALGELRESNVKAVERLLGKKAPGGGTPCPDAAAVAGAP